MKRADRMALGALVFVLGTVDLFVSMRRAPQAIRKALKPLLLWINACRYQESEHEVSRLHVALQCEQDQQRRLIEQRERIAGW